MKSPMNNEQYPDYPENYAKFVAQGFEDDMPVKYTIYCPRCGGDWLIKASKDSNGEQRMQCKRCKHRFRYSAHREESAFLFKIMFFHHKGYSATMIAKELGVHTSTVTRYITKYYPTMKPVFDYIMERLGKN